MGNKRLKDPIYGYIDIPDQYMEEIVDTSEFQRLRRISQTGYSPLYASAVHNRFVHSLGVFHLGDLAIKQILKDISDDSIYRDELSSLFEWEKYCQVFKLACLLHDVGHAPFSHAGEDFYLEDEKDYSRLHEDLSAIVGSDEFMKDVPADASKAAKAHEIMSAIIGISNFDKFLTEGFSKEFFARCITGYKYSAQTPASSVLNCLISLLNSNVIDVDKLDYLIRDAYITGYDTVSIDYIRLLGSLTLYKTEDGCYELAYKKNAVSVLENVVYAHDAERKWIQNHPIVLYDNFILHHIFSDLEGKLNTENGKLFSKEALSKSGIDLKGFHVKLLCDDDIIFLMKSVCSDPLSEEFFERRQRRHPVWKSEAEYNAFFTSYISEGKVMQGFEEAMEATAKFLSLRGKTSVINDELIADIQKELIDVKKSDLDEITKASQQKQKEAMLKVVNCLQKFAKDYGMKNDFVLLMVSQFNSGFGKLDFSNITVVFQEKGNTKPAKVGDIVSSLKARQSKRDNYFYLFYQRESGDKEELDKQELCKRLFAEFI